MEVNKLTIRLEKVGRNFNIVNMVTILLQLMELISTESNAKKRKGFYQPLYSIILNGL